MPTLQDRPTLPLADFDGVAYAEPVEADPNANTEPSECGTVHPDRHCDGFQCPYGARYGGRYDPRTGRYIYGHWVHPDEWGENANSCANCDRCTEHCDCVTCGGCYEQNSRDDICSTCGSCSGGCCDCFHCDSCGETASQVAIRRGRASGPCGECSYCTDCCECSGDAVGIYERDPESGEPHFHTPTAGQLKHNHSKRYAALEIEISHATEGSEVVTASEKWDTVITTDGSIGGGNIDFEINTAPAAGDLLIEQLTDFGNAFAAQNVKANESCGLHVHVDCRDFSFYDIRRLVLLYEKIEPALYHMVPASRAVNTYCVPCGRKYGDAVRESRMPKESKKNIISKVYRCMQDDGTLRRTIREAKAHKYGPSNSGRARYNALNLHSYVYRGTVECRLHHGITDTEGLVNWALLWVSIVDNAYKFTERDIAELSGTPLEMLMALAPNEMVAGWIEAETLKYKAEHARYAVSF